MNTTNRKCEYCHKSIDHRGPKAKTCNNTCKQYAMEVRQGKREPVPELEVETKPEVEAIDRTELEKQLAEMDKVIAESENELMHFEEEAVGLDYQLESKLLMKNFRLRESKNDFTIKHFHSSGEITGSELLKYSTEVIRYPFEKLENPLFSSMGNPIQPFVATINGDKNTGKTVLGVLISNELTNYLGSKVLHVLDFENRDRAAAYYGLTKSSSENLLFKYAKSYNEIVDTLGKDNYEFLILDSIQGLKLSYENLKSIKRDFPKLSIFCVIKGANKSIVDASSISFETEAYSDLGINGANARVFVDGISNEEQQVDIFLNQDRGFSIRF